MSTQNSDTFDNECSRNIITGDCWVSDDIEVSEDKVMAWTPQCILHHLKRILKQKLSPTNHCYSTEGST